VGSIRPRSASHRALVAALAVIVVWDAGALLAWARPEHEASVRLGMRLGNMINDRSLNLDLYQGFEETTVDLYSAVRNGYLQRRENMIKSPSPY
jgi:phospholipid-binding lipoprotein MlaA